MLWKSMENPMDNIYGWTLGGYPYDLGKLRKLPTKLDQLHVASLFS
jgi:hypothetical protein